MTEQLVRMFSPLHRRASAGFVVVLVLLAALTDLSPVEAATNLRVNSDGDCLRLRASAGVTAPLLGCIPDGSSVSDAGQAANADGLAWTLVRWGDLVGWSASMYLVPNAAPAVAAPPAAVAMPSPAPAPAQTVTATRASAALPLRQPPTGGLTVGLVTGVSPRTVVAAQPFEVASLSVYDATLQRFQAFVPGSPVNAIGDELLPANTPVFIRRRGDLPSVLPEPVPTTATAGTPSTLPTPAPGASVTGLAGTGDIAALVAAQPFAVESISTWDAASQRWLSYLVGAPDFANSLTGLLASDSVVFVKRTAAVAGPRVTPTAATPSPIPAVAVTPKTISYGVAQITFYYCSAGARSGSVGDGGGFCGFMANGQRVHAGAASCAAAYMGQRFLIAGDPLARVYTCEDTGGAVTRGHRDIWFGDADEGGEWWRLVGQTAEIFVLVD
ncbi:MAG: hypothetical protein EPO65_05830 [Dehalococcoidia bacterium]|nr:MAG: hypothetical protein EPO65_05830 [Dehalococcoidia bacterium]